MEACKSLEKFQGEMNKQFQGFECILGYLDDLLVMTKDYWTNNLTKLEQVLINHKKIE